MSSTVWNLTIDEKAEPRLPGELVLELLEDAKFMGIFLRGNTLFKGCWLETTFRMLR